MANLARYQAELERLKNANKRTLTTIKSKSAKITHTAISAGTAYVAGAADAQGTNPLPDMFGLDKKLVWGIVTHILATGIKGKWSDSAAAIGDGLIASYAYTEGAGKGYTIKGETGYAYTNVGSDGKDYVEDDIEV
jgi:hypothetical protein